MNSRDVEARVKKIQNMIADLNYELVEDDKFAIISVPCIGGGMAPNQNEIELWFKIGRSEEA